MLTVITLNIGTDRPLQMMKAQTTAECGILSGSTLFATHLTIFWTSTGSRMSSYKCKEKYSKYLINPCPAE